MIADRGWGWRRTASVAGDVTVRESEPLATPASARRPLTTAAAAPQSEILIHATPSSWSLVTSLQTSCSPLAVRCHFFVAKTVAAVLAPRTRTSGGIRKKKRAREVEGNQIRPITGWRAGGACRWRRTRRRMSRGVRLLSLKQRGVRCTLHFFPEKKR